MNITTMTLLAVVAAGATLSAAETEVIWPGGNVKVVAGNCAKVETKGGVVYVTATESRPNVWPAAYFTFPAPRDFSNIAEVRVTFTNCCSESLRLSTKVKADTLDIQTFGPMRKLVTSTTPITSAPSLSLIASDGTPFTDEKGIWRLFLTDGGRTLKFGPLLGTQILIR